MNEKWIMKINLLKEVALILLLFLMCFCCGCRGGGHFDGDKNILVLQKNPKYKKTVACRIEDKRVAIFEDDLDVSIFQLYFDFTTTLYRVYHFFVEEKLGERRVFITYKFPMTYGVGAVSENSDFVIKESSDSITIYYNKEPVDGFNIEQNPFSKKLKIERKNKLYDLMNMYGNCYYRR
jgi:hypothetical protein